LPLIYVLIGVYVAGAIIYAMLRDRKEKTATAGPNNLYALVRLATYPLCVAAIFAVLYLAIMAVVAMALSDAIAGVHKWLVGCVSAVSLWLRNAADTCIEGLGDVIDFYIS
jgi:uncharacterized integral membrane protein